MGLEALAKSKLVTVSRNTGITEAARLMREQHVGEVVVTELHEGRQVPVGMLTDRDLVVTVLAVGADPGAITVNEAMSTSVVAVFDGESLDGVVELMKECSVKRVLIVDENEGLQGMISAEDLFLFLAEQLSLLTGIGLRQKVVESERRRRFA